MYIGKSHLFYIFCFTTANASKVKPFVTGNAFCHLTVVETSTRTKNLFFLSDNFLLFPVRIDVKWKIGKLIFSQAMQKVVPHFVLLEIEFGRIETETQGHGKGNGKQATVRATGLMLNWYCVQFYEFLFKFQNAIYLCLAVVVQIIECAVINIDAAFIAV